MKFFRRERAILKIVFFPFEHNVFGNLYFGGNIIWVFPTLLFGVVFIWGLSLAEWIGWRVDGHEDYDGARQAAQPKEQRWIGWQIEAVSSDRGDQHGWRRAWRYYIPHVGRR